jgi:hypothetical protein
MADAAAAAPAPAAKAAKAKAPKAAKPKAPKAPAAHPKFKDMIAGNNLTCIPRSYDHYLQFAGNFCH